MSNNKHIVLVGNTAWGMYNCNLIEYQKKFITLQNPINTIKK